MSKKISSLDVLAALEADDLFLMYEDSSGITKSMKIAAVISYLNSIAVQLSNLRINEAVAVTATSTEVNLACDGIGSSFTRPVTVSIGDWNMDTTASKNVAHGLTAANIRGIKGIIRNDAATTYYVLSSTPGVTGYGVGIVSYNATNIVLSREDSSVFDSTDFNATGYVRGYLVIDYMGT